MASTPAKKNTNVRVVATTLATKQMQCYSLDTGYDTNVAFRSLHRQKNLCMCPGSNTSDDTRDDTADTIIANTTARDIGDIIGNNSCDDTDGDSVIDGNTGGSTCNVTGVETDSDTWKVTGDDKSGYTNEESGYATDNSPGGATGGGGGSSSCNDTDADSFDRTKNSAITVALVAKQTTTLERLLARSLATTLATSLAVSLVVQQTLGPLASTVTRLHRLKRTTKNVLFGATAPT